MPDGVRDDRPPPGLDPATQRSAPSGKRAMTACAGVTGATVEWAYRSRQAGPISSMRLVQR